MGAAKVQPAPIRKRTGVGTAAAAVPGKVPERAFDGPQAHEVDNSDSSHRRGEAYEADTAGRRPKVAAAANEVRGAAAPDGERRVEKRAWKRHPATRTKKVRVGKFFLASLSSPSEY